MAVALATGTACRRKTVKAPEPVTVFTGFPAELTRVVAYDSVAGTLDGQTGRERREQLRDWLLYTAVSATGLTPEQLSRVLYDVPPVRADFLETVADPPTGPVRSAYLGHGEVLVLTPGQMDAERDEFARMLDDHRRNTGQMPRWLHVFEYEMNPAERSMSARRLKAVDARTFYTAEGGYREVVVRSAGELKSFLDSIDDLTLAAKDERGIRLGGRKLTAGYRGVQLRHVAEIYQADKPYRQPRNNADELIAAYNARWGKVSYRTEAERLDLERQRAAAKRDLEARLDQFSQSAGPRTVCGFSLDPVPEGGPEYRYQRARYICDLQRTETGMVLFYTDLLAKIWAMDLLDTAPRHITDFVPIADMRVSPMYREQLQQLPHTRIWFGPRDSGFQEASGNLLFGRTATRVFARSSASGRAAEEVGANAASGAFMNWWNNHYEEVARWEPEYQRLNQIFKWTLALAWLEKQGASGQLTFLDAVPVRRDLWFPDWAREQPGLRFTRWDQTGFYPPGHAGESGETMQLLRSEPRERFGARRYLSGGVSLGSGLDFRGRPPLPENFGERERRAGLDYPASSPVRLRTRRRLTYSFEDGDGRSKVEASAPEGLPLRGATRELGDSSLSVQYRRQGDALEVTARVGDGPLAGLEFRPTPNGFEVARKQFGTAEAVSMLRKIGASEAAPMEVLSEHPGVQVVIGVEGANEYMVAFSGSEQWLHIQRDAGAGGGLRAGEQKIGGMEENAPTFKTAWLKNSEVSDRLKRGPFVRVERAADDGGGVRVEILNRGPPAAGERAGTVARHLARSDLPDAVLREPRELAKLLPPAGVREFFDSIGSSDYTRAAGEIARRPAELKAELEAYRSSRLNQARSAISRGDFDLSVRKLSSLADLFYEDADVLVSLATSRLARGQVSDAVVDAEASAGRTLREPGEMYQAIESAAAHTTGTPRESMHALRGFAELSHTSSADPKMQMKVFPFERAGRFDFGVELLNLAKSGARKIARPSEGGALYVDVPQPAGPDWTPVFGPASAEVSGRGIESALRLPRADLARMEPSVITDAATRRWYARAPSPGGGVSREHVDLIRLKDRARE
jgi:hypothetical protein